MDDCYFGAIMGLVCGVVLGGGILGLLINESCSKSTEELGQAICEKEYNMDFESYGDTLKCKPKIEVYDGIEVEIGGT